MDKPELVLASQSPRRRQLMTLVCPQFETDVARVDEAAVLAQSPAALAQALAAQKAAAVAARRPHQAVIGCDTVVEVDGRAVGKPMDEADALRMLQSLSGRQHLVHTGVAIWLPDGAAPAECFVETTAVQVLPLPAPALAAYVKTTEPYDKAGGYGIQGWAARFIPAIHGCYYNVMGLPVAALHGALARLGLLPKEEQNEP